MKHTLTFLALFLFTTISQAQIKYVSYGDGWSIPLNSNISFDIDQDGRVDLYINRQEDELGFSPEFIVGCLASPSDSSYVSFGAREMSIFEAGDLIDGEVLGFDNFIDDQRGSAWHRELGFATGWSNEEEKYIGFIILRMENGPLSAKHGWMRIKIDAQNEALVILDLAYEEELNVPIITGSISTSIEILPSFKSLNLKPNPANDLLQISFNYTEALPLNAAIYNELGQKVLDLKTINNKGQVSLNVDLKGLSNGSYYFVINNAISTKTERFTILKE